MADSPGSITSWFQALQAGNRDGVQPLWDRFAHRLIGLARLKLGTLPRRLADEEDVVLSAFDTFCRSAEEGQFPDLLDRSELWHLLVKITLRKAIDLRRHELRRKRYIPDQARGTEGEPEAVSLDDRLSEEPSHELAVMLADECSHLMGLLNDETLQTIALLKMEGYTDDEVAGRLACARRTVQRQLRLIRQIWEAEKS